VKTTESGESLDALFHQAVSAIDARDVAASFMLLKKKGHPVSPVVVEGRDGEDSIAIHHVGALVLAWDHRAFDGAYAASFLNEVRKVLETRDWDAELA